MARVDLAALIPIIPELEDRIRNYRGWLALSSFPKGDGSTLCIAGYEFPPSTIFTYARRLRATHAPRRHRHLES